MTAKESKGVTPFSLEAPTSNIATTKVLRTSTNLRGVVDEKKTKKNLNEEKEVQGDVEGKSFFKCCYNRKHLDEDYVSEQTDNPDEQTLILSKKEKTKSGCVTCDAQIKDRKYLMEDKVPDKTFWEGLDDMDFRLLITELISKPKENPKEKMLSGCEVFCPTLFSTKMGNHRSLRIMTKTFVSRSGTTEQTMRRCRILQT